MLWFGSKKNHLLTNPGKTTQQKKTRKFFNFSLLPKLCRQTLDTFNGFPPPQILQIIALASLLCWAPPTEKPAVSTCLAAKACKFLHRQNPYFQAIFFGVKPFPYIHHHVWYTVRFHQWQKSIGFLCRLYKPCNFDKLDTQLPFLGIHMPSYSAKGSTSPTDTVLSLGPEQTTTSRPGVTHGNLWGIWW